MPRKFTHAKARMPETLNYEDLPPPSVEDREKIIAKFRVLYDQVNARAAKEKRDWYLSMTDFAP